MPAGPVEETITQKLETLLVHRVGHFHSSDLVPSLRPVSSSYDISMVTCNKIPLVYDLTKKKMDVHIFFFKRPPF